MKSIGFATAALSVLFAEAAIAESLTKCEQTVQYNITAPKPDVPADVRAFSGVWIGDWSNQLCGVLIVEAIQSDGTAQTKYVWGSNPGWGIAKPGVSAWTGKIANGVLKLPPNSRGVFVDYTMKGPASLAGVYRGQTQGTFTKQ